MSGILPSKPMIKPKFILFIYFLAVECGSVVGNESTKSAFFDPMFLSQALNFGTVGSRRRLIDTER